MKRVLVLLAAAALASCSGGPRPFVVGSKPFTESELVGELAAVLLEEGLHAKVERRFYLGGSVCFNSLKAGDVDVYAEYTGTGLVNLLGEPVIKDPGQAFEKVKEEFLKRWGVRWLPPLGYNNTYALVMRRDHARQLGIDRISQLKNVAKKLRCGFDLEFSDRPDGYKGLVEHYHLEVCGSISQMNPGLMYQALSDGHVDLISGYTTDARIQSLDLVALQDDQGFFPPYQAALILSPSASKKLPAAIVSLASLSGRLTDAKMTRLNAEVDVKKRPAREVAREFLIAEGLLKTGAH